MSEEKTYRLSQIARKLNVGRGTILDYLSEKGFDVDSSPNSKITEEQRSLLAKEFAASAMEKEEASSLTIGTQSNEAVRASDSRKDKSGDEEILIKDNNIVDKTSAPAPKEEKAENAGDIIGSNKLEGPKVVGKIDLEQKKSAKKEEPAPAPKPEAKEEKKAAEPVKEQAPAAEVKKEAQEAIAPPKEKEEKPAEVKTEAPVEEVNKEEPKVEASKEEATKEYSYFDGEEENEEILSSLEIVVPNYA